MKKTIFIILIAIVFSSCQKKSTIQVQNMLPKAVIQNVEWGGMPISSQINPGESSSTIVIYSDEYNYDISLPESHPLKFYINLNGDKVYLETNTSYNLGEDENLIIIINDTTKVFNPLLENQE